MSPNMVRSVGKPARLVEVVLLALGLLIMASPGSAAPQPQTPQALSATNPPGAPHATCPPDGQCFADVLPGNAFYAFVNRIYQQDLVSGYPCGGAGEPCDPESRPYYRPLNNVTRQQMSKFIDNARHLPGIEIGVSSGPPPITVQNDADPAIAGISTSDVGVYGQSSTSFGVDGYSHSGSGVGGLSDSGTGVRGITASSSGYGVWGTNNGDNPGVRGDSTSGNGVEGTTTSDSAAGVEGSGSGTGVLGGSLSGVGVYGHTVSGWAGYFDGNVEVLGTCCGAGAGTYKIDDPLDPQNKYLYHSAVQSTDMMDIYNGNVTLDAKGEAWVQMPDWFEALNRDFRYQLTTIGGFAPVYIAEKVMDNRFKIAGGSPGLEVSWQVTGIRQDAYANAHRTPVEEGKPADEKGKYLHPAELGQPESLGINYERRQQMQQKMEQVTQSKP